MSDDKYTTTSPIHVAHPPTGAELERLEQQVRAREGGVLEPTVTVNREQVPANTKNRFSIQTTDNVQKRMLVETGLLTPEGRLTDAARETGLTPEMVAELTGELPGPPADAAAHDPPGEPKQPKPAKLETLEDVLAAVGSEDSYDYVTQLVESPNAAVDATDQAFALIESRSLTRAGELAESMGIPSEAHEDLSDFVRGHARWGDCVQAAASGDWSVVEGLYREFAQSEVMKRAKQAEATERP